MPADKRFYSRYEVFLEGRVGSESGLTFSAEILDLSIEGARVRIQCTPPFQVNDNLNLIIKAQKTLKVNGKIQWIKSSKGFTELGIKFGPLDIVNSQLLSSILSELALTKLDDKYLR